VSSYILNDEEINEQFHKWHSDENNKELSPLNDYEKIIKSSIEFQNLFDKYATQFQNFMNGGLNYILLKGPMQNISSIPIETPKEFAPVDEEYWWPAAQFCLIALHCIGLKPIAYNSENLGALFQNIVAGNTKKSWKSLRGHTDAVAFPFTLDTIAGTKISGSPDFVILCGIRNPKQIPTWLVPFHKIKKEVLEKQPLYNDVYVDTLLSDDIYDIHLQDSFEKGCFPHGYKLEKSSILGRDSHGIQAIRFNSAVTVNPCVGAEVIAEASELLSLIRNVLAEDAKAEDCKLHEKIVINPGDVLLVNNRFALHGRAEVTTQDNPETGGDTRWLLRTYGYKPRTQGDAQKMDAPHIMYP
jgi:hypothetical protein